jgi:RNA polymerase sigma-70 factor (ECF subfamily)
MTAYTTNEALAQTQRLVALAQAGDAVALNDLLIQIQPYVLVLAKRKLSDAHEADELAQDVLLKIALKIGQLRETGAFAGWVRQIVCRLAVNRMARRSNMVVCDPDTMDTTCDRFGDPVSHLERDESVLMVRAGLRRLGTVDRQTLEAFYLRGQSLAEMSDSFAAPLGTIKRRLHTARKRLAQEVDTMQAV